MATTLPLDIPIGGVFYTDGGARPNPGNAGWGVHGYFYDKEKEVKNPGKYNVPTTHGYAASYSNTDKSILPVKILMYLDGFGSLFDQTNNVAELEAATQLFDYLLKLHEEGVQLKDVRVFLDSRYVLQGLTEFYPNWARNNWMTSTGKPVSNLTMWKILVAKYLKLKEAVTLVLDWTKGHIGELGNTRADELATRGIFTAINKTEFSEMVLSPVANYQNPKANFNSLFTRNRWYFMTGDDEPDMLPDGRFLYYTGYHGKPNNKKLEEGSMDDDEDEDTTFRPPDSVNWGVAQPDTYFSLVCVKNKEELISHMQRVHNTRANSRPGLLAVGHLSTILSAKTYCELKDYGDLFLTKDNHWNEIITPDESCVTWEIKPQRRAYTALETFDHLKVLLGQYLDNQLTTTPLTDEIYTEVEEGKKVKKIVYKVRDDIPASLKYLDIQANVVDKDGCTVVQKPLRLTLNIDFPVRAHMQRMTEDGTVKPTVTLFTWKESKEAFRYGVAFERNGELLLWVGSDCNLRLFK